MPFTFIIIGLFLIIAAARGKSQNLFDSLHDDFVSSKELGSSFIPWMVSIFAVGALGYVPQLRTFSRVFLVLLIVALFLSKGKTGTAAGLTIVQKLQALFPEVFGKTKLSLGQAAAKGAGYDVG